MTDEAGRILPIHYHEAGHAVVAHLLGVPFHYVDVVPDPDDHRAGGVRWDGVRRAAVEHMAYGDDMVDRALITIFAGAVAEAHFAGGRFDVLWTEIGCESDRAAVREIVDAIAKAHTKLTRDQVTGGLLTELHQAGELIELHVRHVQAVATALANEQRLSAARVGEIVQFISADMCSEVADAGDRPAVASLGSLNAEYSRGLRRK